MRGHSFVELTEYDNSAADITVHSMYIYVLLRSWYIMCTDTAVVTHCKNMDQPGKVANPARSQLNMETENFPVRVRA